MDIKLNLLDKTIAFFNPRKALLRVSARAALGMVTKKRLYEGGSVGRRTKNWKATAADASSEISSALSTLRFRSRDLVRNNPYGKKGVQAIVSNAVGTGIMSRISDDKVQERWLKWGDSLKADFVEKHNFYGLQTLAFRCMVESGEVLIRKRRSANRELPLQIEIMEPDFLDCTKTDQENGLIRDGIEFDSDGRVVAYWLLPVHPGSRNTYIKKDRFKSVRIEASEILHIFICDRAGQTRGVPWMDAVMMKMRDYDDYEEAQLVRQKIAACFVGFLIDNQDPLTQSVSSSEDQKPISEKFEPGAWEVLPPGKDIRFGMPPGVGADYDPYVRRKLQSIAAGLGVSYEALTGDLSNVNFSSGRMGWLEFHRNIEQWRWITFIPRFCEGVLKWWLEAESVADNVAIPSNLTTVWTPPRREMIDPVKETEAMKSSVRAGFDSLSESVRQLGKDPKEHFSEMQKDFNMLDKLGLVLDSDPRKDAKAQSNSPIQEDLTGSKTD